MQHMISSSLYKHLETNSILNMDLGRTAHLSQRFMTQPHALSLYIKLISSFGLSKALNFDKVPREWLLYKLDYYGIGGPYLEWIKQFFINRTQQVAVDNKLSNLSSGAPQGSVLCPLLSLLFINDLPNNILQLSFILMMFHCLEVSTILVIIMHCKMI